MHIHNKKLVPLAKELRKNMTKEERKLWYDFLRNHPLKFLRQKIIDNYIADFYCPTAKLVIELDGGGHFNQENLKADKIRDDNINKFNIKVARIPNNEINDNFEGVCEYINLLVKPFL